MVENNTEWLPHLSSEIVSDVHGNLLDAYAVALEGWQRGLKLRWHVKDSEKFREMETWFVDNPGQLFSLTSAGGTHYFFRTRGDKISNEAVYIGKDKNKTKQILSENGIPIPEGAFFSETQSNSDIHRYASSIGFPVVVKSLDGSFGRGILTNIQDENELEYALIYVRGELKYKNVIVEHHIPGNEYRIYVVGNKVVGAINRIPANVIGDGANSIETLIKNKNKKRMENPRLKSCPINITKELEIQIDKLNYDLNSVPKTGEKVFLSEKSNISLGGDPVDVLDDLPLEIMNTAVGAIQAIPGLVHGAVDLILSEQHPTQYGDGVVLEVNPTAQIGSLLYPIKGKGRDIPAKIIDYYFPETKGKGKASNLYFNLSEVLSPLADRIAAVTEVNSVEPTGLYVRKITVFEGESNSGSHYFIKQEALKNNLFGFTKIHESGATEIVIASHNKQSLDNFRRNIIESNSIQSHIKEEVVNDAVQLGFFLDGDKTQLINELTKVKEELRKVKKKKQASQKQYQKMLGSRVWRATRPLRNFTSLIRKLAR
ncbi:ATP-grasp domain-containing protein [Lentibacillus sp. CBA3610]|uniref:ATP-grasp domain-containing protein n=1 Tax=Lentibacillus sp. CBA3610 TaxID=2518176 RepID=UPI00159509DE|nr:ATP-grasp domain-containing protein [Lentibacillus sp. CBA3610]QKY70432.1 ATP-grasp domain-containing protein [Lentibacillus sp. CBA3610]